jgi:hypothetical protein
MRDKWGKSRDNRDVENTGTGQSGDKILHGQNENLARAADVQEHHNLSGTKTYTMAWAVRFKERSHRFCLIAGSGTSVLHAPEEAGDVWVAGDVVFSDMAAIYEWTVRVEGRGDLVMALGIQRAGRDIEAAWSPTEMDRWTFHPARGQFGGHGNWPVGSIRPLACGELLGFRLNMAAGRLFILINGIGLGHEMSVPTGVALQPVFCLHSAGCSLHAAPTPTVSVIGPLVKERRELIRG